MLQVEQSHARQEFIGLVTEGRWREATALANSPDTPVDGPMLRLRATVAIELADAAELRRIVDLLIAKPEIPNGPKVSTAAILARCGWADLAWEVMASLKVRAEKTPSGPEDRPKDWASPRVPRIYGWISKKAKSPEIRSKAQQMNKDLIKSNRRSPGTPSQYRFTAATPALASEFGHIEYIAAEGCPPRHEARFRELGDAFDAVLHATKPPPVVRVATDVYVSGLGQIWKADGTVLASGGRPVPNVAEITDVQEFDDAVLCSDATKGFFHWYVERLSSLAWRFNNSAPDFPILFGSHAGGFQFECLRLLGAAPDTALKIKQAAYCKRVYTSRHSIDRLKFWDQFSGLYDKLAAAAAAESNITATDRMIYISRRDSSRRVLKNEQELEDRLQAMGVEPVLFSTMPLADQIQLVRSARLVVAPHGAGISHMLNARPGTQILELMPISASHHTIRFNFARLSRLRGHHHVLYIVGVDPLSDSWSVDIPTVLDLTRKAIDRL